jgi:nucleoside-diphosphate-sugar epimerase
MVPISCITGGTGFIGQCLVARLLSVGHRLRIIARSPEKAERLFKDSVEIIPGDLCDSAALSKGVTGADFVFHLAARVGDFGPKKEFFKINCDGTRLLVEACMETRIKRFIHMSTNAVIGIKREKVTTEQTPYSNTGGPYGITKGISERYVLEKHRKENFPAVVIRPAVVYGPGSPMWVMRPLGLMEKNKMVLIDSGRGHCWHVFIDNLIDAVMLALEKKEAVGEVFIITDGDNGTTWADYFNTLADAAGYPPITRNLPKPLALTAAWAMYGLYKTFRIPPMLTPLGVGIITSQAGVSIEKARKILDYDPKIDLAEGMRRVGEWLNKEGLYKE